MASGCGPVNLISDAHDHQSQRFAGPHGRRHCGARCARAQSPAMTRVTAYAFSFKGLEGGDIRLADYAGKPILDRQYRLALRLHPAIYRAADALDALPRPRPDGHRRALERFRRPGAGRPEPRSCRRRTASTASPSRSRPRSAVKGAEPASVLQVGGARAAARHAALEFSQISRRPRRPHRRRVPDRHGADGRARHQRDREGIARRCRIEPPAPCVTGSGRRAANGDHAALNRYRPAANGRLSRQGRITHECPTRN